MPNTMLDLEPLLGLFAHPLEPLDYMVIRWTLESKSSSLALNSSKSRTHSPIDEVAKRSRADLVEFLTEKERERAGFFFVKNWEKKLMKKERG